MRTETEIRLNRMQALIGSLGLIEAERFLIAVSQEKFDYTEWRRQGLPTISLLKLAESANQLANKMDAESDQKAIHHGTS